MAQNYQDFNRYGIMRLLPKAMQEYYLLARLDRPVGWQLLYWPCCFGLVLGFYHLGFYQQIKMPHLADFLTLAFWVIGFAIGAISMRAAGCIWNDILDRKIDKNVERTKNRPLAAGTISVRNAVIFACFWLMIGFIFFLFLPLPTKIMALSILPIVLIYPLMKRIFTMPQLILGLAFNWGAICGYSAITQEYPSVAVFLLWLAGIFWTLCYDTIYACQDKKFDKTINIKSMAVFLGDYLKPSITLFYLLFMLCYIGAFWIDQIQHIVFIAIFISALTIVMLVKLYRLDIHHSQSCLTFFKQNSQFGMYCFLFSLLPFIAYPIIRQVI